MAGHWIVQELSDRYPDAMTQLLLAVDDAWKRDRHRGPTEEELLDTVIDATEPPVHRLLMMVGYQMLASEVADERMLEAIRRPDADKLPGSDDG